MEEKQMWDLRMAVYAAMVDRLDQNIGHVIKCLEQMGELDNTLILFLSDNGGCHESVKNKGSYIRTTGETGNPDSFDAYEFPWANVSNTPFRMHKHWVHEGGISTPFIAFLPAKIESGKIIHQPGHIIDIMPTLLNFANASYPLTYKGTSILQMEGKSLKPLLEGRKTNRDTPLFWEHEGNRAIREGNWKLVSQYDYQAKKFMKWELYNLKKDRTELNDLDLKNTALKDRMIREWENWANRVGVVPKEVLDAKR